MLVRKNLFTPFMKKMLKILIIFFVVIIVLFGLFLLIATIKDYQPDEETEIFSPEIQEIVGTDFEINILTWNIGYCGLSSETDFFYDGGKSVFPSKKIVERNLDSINNFLKKNENYDFILLQEIDEKSKRTYRFNQFDTIAKLFEGRNSSFGKNYDVFFVPQPITKPMGRVKFGLMTISKYVPSKVIRYSFPGNYSWPVRLFFLDRCFLVNRYTLANEKELIVINTHNSAYDNGSLRNKQMEYLKIFLKSEYEKGNYIIVGGDWNQCPPNFNTLFNGDLMDFELKKDIPYDFLPKWTWAYDNTLPTNRRVDVPYKKGKTLTTVIDFYLLSPNIKKISIKNIDLGFENSDHNPVSITIKLN